MGGPPVGEPCCIVLAHTVIPQKPFSHLSAKQPLVISYVIWLGGRIYISVASVPIEIEVMY